MGMQNISDTPSADQRQHSAENLAQYATLAARAPVQTVSLAQAGAGKLSDAPATSAGHVDQPDEKRRVGAGARSLRPSSAIRTKPDHVPAQPGIVENTESGFTSAPPPAGHSAHHRRHVSKLTHEGELRQDDADEYRRVRDGDQPAATWCSDRGEFVPATGPPPNACHLYP